MIQAAPFLERQEKNWSGLARGLSKGWVPEKGRTGAFKTTTRLRVLEVLVAGLSGTHRTGACVRRRSTLHYLFLTLQHSQCADHSIPLWGSVWGRLFSLLYHHHCRAGSGLSVANNRSRSLASLTSWGLPST